MVVEIKEIFECMRKCINLTPDFLDDLDFVEDYITNLEQENEKLLREKIQKELCESLLDECEAHNKYLQDKIDKAVGYIKEQVGNEIHDMMYVIDVSEVLDILTGGDDYEKDNE